LNQNKNTNIIAYEIAGNRPYKILGFPKSLGVSLFSLMVNQLLAIVSERPQFFFEINET